MSARMTVAGFIGCLTLASCGGVDPGHTDFHDCDEDLYYSGWTSYELEMSHFEPRTCPVSSEELDEGNMLSSAIVVIDGEPWDDQPPPNGIHSLDLLVTDSHGGANVQYSWASFVEDGLQERKASLSMQYEVDYYDTGDYYDIGLFGYTYPDRPNNPAAATADGLIEYCWPGECPGEEAQ